MKTMRTDVLVIGGGLSGLTATWQLRAAGMDASVIEARSRFGGRILTADADGADCDLGPSWFWPGQPLVASLLDRFNIQDFEQFVNGAILFQRADGHIERADDASPMAGSRRIEGGVHRLTNAIAQEIDASHRFLAHRALALTLDGNVVDIDVVGPSGELRIQAKQVALAMPPRLAAELAFLPELPTNTMQTLAKTPTWMAGHAKFFAVYDDAFWRNKGLCGTAFSESGPLAEIHDASPSSESTFSLFGFSGLDAESRSQLGRSEFVGRAKAQLAALFGDEANRPRSVHFQDWSTERFTANLADREPQTRHPHYGLNLQVGPQWSGKLELISTETSFTSGGLIEGALEAGLGYSRHITGLDFPTGDESSAPHTASMGWDWL